MKPHLLPMHYQLGRQLGLTPAQVKRFHAEVMRKAAEGPQPAVVAGTETLAIISLAASAISIGLAVVAQLFRPGEIRPGRLRAVAREGRTISDIRRYAPRDGFDSLQDVAPLGEIMPLVFANRETIEGVVYGGVRIDTPLLWSQIQTVNGQELIKLLLLIADGGIDAVDPNGFAIGNNILNAYNLDAGTQIGSSYSVYLKKTGGRPTSLDYIAGKQASLDPGNSQNYGGSDVYSIRSIDRNWAADFCAVSKPSTNAQFGVYSLIGNNIGLRVNPIFRPKYQAQLVPEGDDGDGKVKCQLDEVVDAERRKSKAFFSTRSGLISGDASAIGNTLTYVLLKSSDALTDFGKALDAGAWSATVRAERTSGSGTVAPGYSSTGNTTSLVVDGVSTSSVLASHIRWLDASDQVVSQPIVTVTPSPNPNSKKVTLSTRLKFDENYPSPLTAEEKRQLLYTKFRITFVNSVVDNDDEPSVYYRVVANQKSDINQTYSLNVDFQNEEASLSINYDAASTNYTINETVQVVEASFNKADVHSETAGDAASTISGKQQQWDDSIQVGSLYKIGTALVVCSARTPDGEVFQSEADFDPVTSANGQSITATFTVIRPGTIATIPQSTLEVAANAETQPGRAVATNFPHVMRVSIGSFTTTRKTQLISIGIKSNLGIRATGLCNFRDVLSFSEVDSRACLSYKGDIVSSGSTLKQYTYTSGTVTTSQTRFSFHRIRVKKSGSSDNWITFPQLYGFKGISQQSQINLISIQFPTTADWQIEFEPISSWEIRSGAATGELIVIDDKLSEATSLITRVEAGATIYLRGEVVARSAATFRLPGLARGAQKGGGDLGLGYADGGQFVDEWGALAESFIYPEVSCTAENGPEHEIAFVNEIVQNLTAPQYQDIAIAGLNILPGTTFQQFGQFSSYVLRGNPKPRRLLNGLTPGPTHLLPDIGLFLLTNREYGSGESVSDDQIIFEDFTESAQWCYDNRYFFDGGYVGQNNPIEWLSDKAPFCLLDVWEIGSKFSLTPVFPHSPTDFTDWNVSAKISNVFNFMQMRNFAFASIDEQTNRTIQVSIKWREERQGESISSPGIFPVEREILVREAAPYGSESDPIVRVDQTSDWITNEKQAIDYAKYLIRKARLESQTATIELTQDSLLNPLKPGSYIGIPFEMTYFDEFSSGIVREDGTLVATSDMQPGVYQASIWNGQLESPVESSTITVLEDGTASPTGIIFIVESQQSDFRTYKVMDVTPGEKAGFTLQVVEAPTDSSGRLLMSQNWGSTVSDAYWVILK